MQFLKSSGSFKRSPLTIAALVAAAATVTGAGAATLHRFTVTQTTGNGSGGATTFFNSAVTGGALQTQTGASAPDTALTIPFSLFGEYNDNSTGTFGIGVAGLAITGYGVAAESLDAKNPAVYTQGVYDGMDSYSSGSGSFGVYGESDSPDSGTGAFGYDNTANGGFGLYGQSGNSVGIAGESENAAGVAVGALTTAGNNAALFEGVSATTNGSIPTFYVTSTSANASGSVLTPATASDVLSNGDLYLTGHVYTGCTAFPPTASNCTLGAAAVARTSGGQMVQTYGSRHATPTMEDEGEAQLVNGAAHVALDPAFAATISTAAPYLVFTTPRGDSRGLYVTHVTASGFDVKESAGGRSTLAFDYRIVAHPYGDRSARLAIVSPGRGQVRATALRAFSPAALRRIHSGLQTRHAHVNPFAKAAAQRATIR